MLGKRPRATLKQSFDVLRMPPLRLFIQPRGMSWDRHMGLNIIREYHLRHLEALNAVLPILSGIAVCNKGSMKSPATHDGAIDTIFVA